MSFLLDTSVISESAKPHPDPDVMAWLAAIDEEQLFLSIITLAELRHRVERLASSHRKSMLDAWLTNQLPQRFHGRLLHADADTAEHWGHIVAHADARGRPIGAMDAFLAATAVQHRLTLVTRNITDFQMTGVPLFNPWPQS